MSRATQLDRIHLPTETQVRSAQKQTQHKDEGFVLNTPSQSGQAPCHKIQTTNDNEPALTGAFLVTS